jgi:PAS domain S-box-containing protein
MSSRVDDLRCHEQGFRAAPAQAAGTGDPERLRHLFDQAPGLMCVLRGPDHVFEFANAAYLKVVRNRAVIGRPVREALPDLEGQGFFELLDEVFATGKPYVGQQRRVQLRTEAGEADERYMDFVYQPITGPEGDVDGIFVQATEVTDRVQAERRIRFQARLLDAVQQAIIATDLSGVVLYWNRFAEALYGWSADEAVGRSILDLNVASTTRSHAQEVMAQLERGETWSGEIELRRRDGTTFPAFVSDGPVHDDAGKLIGIVGVSFDVTERRRAQEKQSLLVRELHHRVKNTLATVQAIMGSTARSSVSMEEFQRAFAARIASLANTHSLLAEDRWQVVGFRELLEAELAPYDDGTGKRIVLDGPPVVLSSELAVPIGMAVHELTTNAAKHGALAEIGSSVVVRWSLLQEQGARKLRWEWREHDGAPVELPTREGFGSRLLRRVLTAQIGADVDIEFARDGIRVLVLVPIPEESATPA